MCDRGARHRDQPDVVVLQVDGEAVEAIGDRRARRAAARVVGSEHEVVDEELRAPTEEVGQRRGAGFGLEAIVLLDGDPGQLLALAGHVVAAAGQLLLGLEQLEAGGEPLLASGGWVVWVVMGLSLVVQVAAMATPRATIASARGTSTAG